jgi:hypothetical protein
MLTEAIYCSSLSEEFSFDGHPIFISPLLWTTLHEIPQKVSHYQTFESRLIGVVTAAKCYLKKALSIQEKASSFSALLLTSNPENERQNLIAELFEDTVSMKLAIEQ